MSYRSGLRQEYDATSGQTRSIYENEEVAFEVHVWKETNNRWYVRGSGVRPWAMQLKKAGAMRDETGRFYFRSEEEWSAFVTSMYEEERSKR